jgi:hypothetical protein
MPSPLSLPVATLRVAKGGDEENVMFNGNYLFSKRKTEIQTLVICKLLNLSAVVE